MAGKKIGAIIKEARTKKGLTQAQLADAADGLSAADISKIERGEKEPTAAQAKQMAKPLGLTQKSLVEALSGNAKTTASAKTASAQKTTGTAKKTTGTAQKTAGTAKKTTGTAKKTSGTAKKTTQSGTSVKLTATEKKLVDAYRNADSTTKKTALNILQGKAGLADITALLIAAKNSSSGSASGGTSSSSSSGNAVNSVLQNIFGKIVKGGNEESTNPLDTLIEGLQAAAPKEDGDELILLE